MGCCCPRQEGAQPPGSQLGCSGTVGRCWVPSSSSSHTDFCTACKAPIGSTGLIMAAACRAPYSATAFLPQTHPSTAAGNSGSLCNSSRSLVTPSAVQRSDPLHTMLTLHSASSEILVAMQPLLNLPGAVGHPSTYQPAAAAAAICQQLALFWCLGAPSQGRSC